ncbi:hypothetical protein B0J14DRAFT_591655 [Halenospora varia]|nr:hypothetical protein B0J14DRAFT_591655 [Halenospora varia]
MSKRQFRTQASSSRAAPATAFGGFGSTSARSSLSYVTETPNLSKISDPNVVVAFKNLSKADSTTKTKALEVLQEYVSHHPYEEGGTEDAVLLAWVKFYPRVSINNNRRVREQAHTLQLMLLKSARKRMEKHIPDTVGSWLAGCYDRDGFVARAAENGISSFLDTDAKVVAFWTRCQSQILDYAEEAINETSESLSDERNTSADDAQALYLRVVGSSISLVANLLVKINKKEVLKYQEKYESFLQNKKLWGLASSEDPFIRKTIDNLLIVSLEKQKEVLQTMVERISNGFINKALRASQSTSSLQLLQALSKLTVAFPEVWTSAYKDKDKDTGNSFKRLRAFIQKGSQGSSVEYWILLQDLLSKLPPQILPSDKVEALETLNTFRNSIEGREEPRQHADQAWLSYFATVGVVTNNIEDSAVRAEIFREAVYPILEGYMIDEPGRSPVTASASVKASSLWYLQKDLKPQDSLAFSLQKLVNAFIARSLTSAHTGPETSESQKQAQRKIIAEGHRWFSLLAEVLKFEELNDLANLMIVYSRGIYNSAVKTIIGEEGKAYSATAIVEIALRLTPVVVCDSPETLASFKSLVTNDLPKPRMIMSASSRHLVSLLFILRSIPSQEDVFEEAWKSAINSLLKIPTDSSTFKVFTALLANEAASNLSQSFEGLQELLLKANTLALQGDSDARSLFETAITFDCYAGATTGTLMSQILQHCNSKDAESHQATLDNALKSLEFISVHKPGLLNDDSDNRIVLITILLEITEISDKPLALRAMRLKIAVEKAGNASEMAGQSSALDLVRWNLELEPHSPRMLLIETLVQQAKSFQNVSGETASAAAFFPDAGKWSEVLEPSLSLPPTPALGVMRPFAGSVFLASNSSSGLSATSVDPKTFLVALRMALYASNIIDDINLVLRLPKDLLVDILHSLVLTTELVSDQLDLLADGEFPAWATEDDDEMDELRNLASNACMSSLISRAKRWQDTSLATEHRNGDSSIAIQALVAKLSKTIESGPGQYYAVKALSHLVGNLVDTHGWDAVIGDTWISGLEVLGSTVPKALATTAILTGLGTNLESSRVVNTFCNRLISDVAGTSATSDKALGLLVSLNAALVVYQEDEIPVTKNRIIFAVKQILSWTETLASENPQLSSEACRALQVLLPAMKDVYGTYWESTLDFCISIWRSSEDGELSDERLPMIGMSLKLYSILRKLEDPNDDLQEALSGDYPLQISQCLINLLKLRRSKDHQPLEFVDTLLLRQLRDIPLDLVKDLSEFYPLLASENRNLQSAAYDVLHRALPAIQQQISVDAALEDKDARLPDELLSLLLDPPSFSAFSDEMLEGFPASIRGYLLSWHLVYDSYANASFKVRNDYSEILKSENYIGPLLSFLFDVLGLSAGKAINLDKTRLERSAIQSYDMWAAIDSESPKFDMRWLLVNVYYSSLKFTANLVKSWWRDCRSKQTSIAVNNWTEEYFSPILIHEAKEDVSKWAEEQEPASDDENNLVIKVSKNTPNIQAGYEIDDMMMQINIVIPDNYPLQGVEVKGGNRVAVKEKTWNSWLMTTQGVMTFNNGSIIDGLTVFRRNVVAALKGHTECAICYSIISSDKKMPEKRCQTCKNLFHSSCLFKWFQSSNQSTCPLCRNPFNYGTDSARKARDYGAGP